MNNEQQLIPAASRHTLPSGLIHDLRTPLNQIIGYSEMLVEQAQEARREDSVPDLLKMRAAGQQILTLINDNFQVSEQESAESLVSNHAELLIPPSTPTVVTLNEYVAAGPAKGQAKGHLLVVDDNEANRDVLSRRLESQGYTVKTAENGKQALEMLHADFDLILLDIMMPEMDGYEVLRRLKEDDRLRHIPVVVVSALHELESVARCIEMGADDYLSKPFNATLLKARVFACLEKKRSRDRETDLFQQVEQNYKRLQELEMLRDDLTHMIIHDLRTPLTSVISGMQSLAVLGELNSNQREVAEMAALGGETLLGIINDLLDVAKLESGAMKLDYALLSPDALVASALLQVRPLAKSKNLTLLPNVEPDVPAIQGDEGILIRILVNLLGNAIKFTPAGGKVTVGARHNAPGQSVEFFVSDSGAGIPSESFGHIFDKFAQLESGKGSRKMSTGLGLTFCKLGVESHGGTIGVDSGYGQGSTFGFTIPLLLAPAGSRRN